MKLIDTYKQIVKEDKGCPAATQDLDPGKYTYDVVMITQGGTQTKILEGLTHIVPTMTRV